MLDVIIALLPIAIVAVIAYGLQAFLLISVSIGVCILTDFIFSALLLKKYDTILDGSAIVTGLLMVFTISPLVPWYVVAFGAFAAILFGKIIWGGLGKNRFNPALVGREFMSVFFASIMTSPTIWNTVGLINIKAENIFPGLQPFADSYFSRLLYKTSGSMGEYSVALLVLGGIYLLLRKRISWHIPFSVLTVFSLLFWVIDNATDFNYSLSGVMLGTLFMATDMPSSPSTSSGKLYYGTMIGLVAFILIAGGVHFEYMSYAILILNGFSLVINNVLRPRVWGTFLNQRKRIEQLFLLTLAILGTTMAVLSLHYYGLHQYLLYTYIVYVIFKFNFSTFKETIHPI